MNSFDKIIATLDLANSAARNETIISIIEYTLYSYGEKINKKELINLIKVEFNIELYEGELNQCLDELISIGEVLLNKEKYCLSDEKISEIHKAKLKIEEEKNERRANFDKIIDEVSATLIQQNDKDELWAVFSDYLYDCFLQNGKEAIYLFIPKQFSADKQNYYNIDNIIKIYISKVTKPELIKVFQKIIEVFPQKLNSKDLQYLENLSRKTESFYSLGLSAEEYKTIQDFKILDWTIFVDTNFLYSILNLHYHQENSASKELLYVTKKYNLNLRFRYLPATLKELLHKKDDFEKFIPKNNFKPSQIQALIESGKLDSFSRNYYEKKLSDPNNTPHPTDIVSNAQLVLQSNSILIWGNSFEHLQKNEKFLNLKQSEYEDFIRFINEVRQEKGLDQKIKDPHQTLHDVILREAILNSRTAIKNININEAKYFGLTLDKFLLRFDRYVLGKNNPGIVIPTFFLPSALLKKIVKFLPVITDDYRRAFISAISSSALEANKQKSTIAQRSMQYFKNMGIEDKELIIALISNNTFLSEFEKTETEEEKIELIESEIKNKYEEVKRELDIKRNEIAEKEKNEKESKTEIINKDNELIDIKNKLELLSGKVSLYKRAVDSLKKIPKEKIVINQLPLPFDEEERKNLENENEALRSKIKSESQKEEKIINWVLLNKKCHKLYFLFHYFLLLGNFSLFVFIIISGIKTESSIKEYCSLSAVGLPLLLYLIPKLREKIFILYIINLVVFIIYFFFLYHNYEFIHNLYFPLEAP